MTCKIIKNGNNEASKLEENSFELQNENIDDDLMLNFNSNDIANKNIDMMSININYILLSQKTSISLLMPFASLPKTIAIFESYFSSQIFHEYLLINLNILMNFFVYFHLIHLVFYLVLIFF